MSKKTEQKLDALIFIDTNIFLDFYRFRNSDVSVKFLEQIEKHKEILITTKQVEMEFKKNRQSVLSTKYDDLKKSQNDNPPIPDILLDDPNTEKIIKDANDLISKEKKKLYEKMEAMLKSPSISDPVFKTINKIFDYSTVNQLSEINDEIYSLAQKRFNMGYPPRKSTDNSFGDAINWEWIIKCGQVSKKDIIIISRDGDYGRQLNKVLYLNDFLIEEFQDRTGGKTNITITDKLTTAFKQVKIPVTEEMIKEENKVDKLSFVPKGLEELMKEIEFLKVNGLYDSFYKERIASTFKFQYSLRNPDDE